MLPKKINAILALGDESEISRHFSATYFNIKRENWLFSVYESNHSNNCCVIFFYVKTSAVKGLEEFYRWNKKYSYVPWVIITEKFDSRLAIEFSSLGIANILLVEDVTADLLLVAAEKAIKEKKKLMETNLVLERYTLVTEVTKDMIYEIDLKQNFVYRNPEQFSMLTGFSKSYLNKAGEFWLRQIHSSDYEQANKIFEDSLSDSEKKAYSVDYRFLNKKGEYRYFNDKAVIKRNVDGIATSVTGMVRDITEAKLKEIELKKLSLIAKGTHNGVVLADSLGRIKWVNESFSSITGYQLSEIIGKTAGSFLQGEETDKVVAGKMRDLIKEQKGFTETILNYNKSGTKYWNKIQVEPVYNDVDNEINFIGFQKDVTENKLLTDQLISAKEQYQLLFDNNPLGIALWDSETGNVLQVNNLVCAMTGYSKEEFASFNLGGKEGFPNIRYKKISTDFNGYIGFNNQTSFFEVVTKGNKKILLQVYSYIIKLGDREAVISIGNDVTKQLKLSKQIIANKEAEELKIKRAINKGREKEMAFLGRELHDNVVQLLASCKLYHKMLKLEKKDNIEYATHVDEYLGMAMKDLRELSHSLVPPSLKENNLTAAIKGLSGDASLNKETRFELLLDRFQEKRFNSEFKLSLYRIIQEQINNIRKYAKASEIKIALGIVGNNFKLLIKDNGVGFDINAVKKGIGLDNISERAKVFLGTMNIKSHIGKGVEMAISYPLTNSFWEIAGCSAAA